MASGSAQTDVQHIPIRSYAASNSPSSRLLGEMVQVSSVPMCHRVCFIFKRADDYYRSPGCQNFIKNVFTFARLLSPSIALFVLRPIMSLLMAGLCDTKRDHDRIIGYDESQ
jgi:1,3-beta-glucan synthase